LAGIPVSVKDLFDVAGPVTTAGSRVLASAAPARADAVAVARLRAAGAALVGRTNMVEFAFSGVGANPHYGTPVNPADPDTERIPGGSSSGAAVSVATGAALVGLGSDMGGSIRIPAALCGIVGFKSTARLVPVTGAVPLSTSLDTICTLTRSVRDAVSVHEVLSARKVQLAGKPLLSCRLAVAQTLMQNGLSTSVARAFEHSL
jgi:aspartyl-tRNA(Asn)/glutamyl-tRNA(Gln) amidotransferase subunit A